MSVFETQVYPVIERLARKAFRGDAGRVSDALVLGWYYWSRGPQELPPSIWARTAVRAVWAGRDLPGIAARSDALDRAFRGAAMSEVVDRRPGPLHIAAAKEEYERLLASLSERQRLLVEAVADGTLRTDRLAAALGVSPGRVSQMRREILERLGE